jgi:replicative DNA helicase
LITVAARPSVGKTAFALNVAQRAAKKTMDPIAIFSNITKNLVYKIELFEANPVTRWQAR